MGKAKDRDALFEKEFDPIVAEVRKTRAKLAKKYKTIDAYIDHLEEVGDAETMIAKINEQHRKRRKTESKRNK